MSKKVFLIITTLVLAATFSIVGMSCGPSEPSQFVTYIDEAGEFSIDHPDGWHVETHKESSDVKVSIWEKEFGLNPVGIMIAKYAASGHSLESFSEFQIGALPDITEDYVPISTEELTINGIPAIKHIHTSTINPATYKSVRVYLVSNGTGWILGFNSPQKSFDSYKSTFDTSLNSFSLLE